MSQQEDGSAEANPPAPTEQDTEDLAGTADELAGNPVTGSNESRDNGNEVVVDEASAGRLESPQSPELPLVSPPGLAPVPTSSTAQLRRPPSPGLARPFGELPLPHPELLSLSPDDISKFEEDGFVMLKRAFHPEVAAACR